MLSSRYVGTGSTDLMQKLEQELEEKLDLVQQEPQGLDFDERPFLLVGGDRKVASNIFQSPGPANSLSSPRPPLKSRYAAAGVNDGDSTQACASDRVGCCRDAGTPSWGIKSPFQTPVVKTKGRIA